MNKDAYMIIKQGSLLPTPVFEAYLQHIKGNCNDEDFNKCLLRSLLSGMIGMRPNVFEILTVHWQSSGMVKMETGGSIYSYLAKELAKSCAHASVVTGQTVQKMVHEWSVMQRKSNAADYCREQSNNKPATEVVYTS